MFGHAPISVVFLMAATILLTAGVGHVYADPGTPSKTPIYVDPVRDYYDAQNELARELWDQRQPVYYEPFSPTISTDTNCGWTEIVGQVPYSGLVEVSVYSYSENPDDYIYLLKTANINSNPGQLLRGFIDLPCSDESQSYDVLISWQELPYEIHGMWTTSYLDYWQNFRVTVN